MWISTTCLFEKRYATVEDKWISEMKLVSWKLYRFYSGTVEIVSATFGIVWQKFWELSGGLVGKHVLSIKQHGKICEYCIWSALLH